MTRRRSLIIALTAASTLTAACAALIAVGPESLGDFCRLLLMPGFVVDACLSGNVHQGFGGMVGVLTMGISTAVIWTIPLYAILEVVRLLGRSK